MSRGQGWRLLGSGLKAQPLGPDAPAREDRRRARRGRGSRPWVSPGTRTAITRLRALGWPTGAIADHLGLSVATVESVPD